MRISSKLAAIGFTGSLLLFGSPASSPAPAYAQSEQEKTEIQLIIREYLLEHPELLLEMQEALQKKQQAELALRQEQFLAENTERIYASPYQIVFGPADAENTIVEFFDYNCGFCQRAVGDMEHMLNENKNVRFILKEFPVLGEQSVEAAQVSMAFGKLNPDLHAKFHLDLLALEGIKDGQRALDLAESMGVNRDALEKELTNPEINNAIRDVYEIADGLGISGTPSYVSGNQVIFGAVGHEQLTTALQESTN